MRGTQKQKNHLKWNAGNGVLHENEVIRSVFSMKVTVYILLERGSDCLF